jgi:hypothetical protein
MLKHAYLCRYKHNKAALLCPGLSASSSISLPEFSGDTCLAWSTDLNTRELLGQLLNVQIPWRK